MLRLGEIPMLFSFQKLQRVSPSGWLLSVGGQGLTSGSLSCIVLSVVTRQHWSLYKIAEGEKSVPPSGVCIFDAA